MRRRQFLALGTTVSMAALSGCAGIYERTVAEKDSLRQTNVVAHGFHASAGTRITYKSESASSVTLSIEDPDARNRTVFTGTTDKFQIRAPETARYELRFQNDRLPLGSYELTVADPYRGSLFAYLFFLLGLPAALIPYRLSRLTERIQAIGSKRSWSEVEPADWRTRLTSVTGIGMVLLGVGLLASVLVQLRMLPAIGLFVLGFPLTIWPGEITRLVEQTVGIDGNRIWERFGLEPAGWRLTPNRILGIALLSTGTVVLFQAF